NPIASNISRRSTIMPAASTECSTGRESRFSTGTCRREKRREPVRQPDLSLGWGRRGCEIARAGSSCVRLSASLRDRLILLAFERRGEKIARGSVTPLDERGELERPDLTLAG